MGFFSKFEGRMEDTFENVADKMFDSPISPVQIAKKAEKAMKQEKLVGAGKQYAPTLYTVLVNYEDDQRLFGYYPTLAGETETYLSAKAVDHGLVLDGQPLVRFIADDTLKRGKFDIVAELVAAPVVSQLRAEEMERYGLNPVQMAPNRPESANPYASRDAVGRPYGEPLQVQQQSAYADIHPDYYDDQRDPHSSELPYIPEEEIDYSLDYGEYTFNSEDFVNHSARVGADPERPLRGAPSLDHPLTAGAAIAQAGLAGANNAHEGAQQAAGNLAGAAAQIPIGSAAAYVPVGALQASDAKPRTVAFTSGAGNANPIPNNAAVRAQILNLLDNRTYNLATNRVMIGRDRKNDIVVDDINASRSHAELRFEQQGIWALYDLGSTNGTLVNGREVHSQVLNDGDQIKIGMTTLVLMLS